MIKMKVTVQPCEINCQNVQPDNLGMGIAELLQMK